MIRPLRQRLFLVFAVVATAPLLVAGLFGMVWFYPHLEHDIRERQVQLAQVISSELNTYLKTARETVRTTAVLPLDSHLPDDALYHLLNAQVQTSETLRDLYVLDRQGRVTAIGLRSEHEVQRADLLNLDLTRSPLWQLAQRQQSLCSDTYLSLVGGGLTVAMIEPLRSGGVVIGEVDLTRLTGFLRKLTQSDALLLVIDRNGQVIADEGGRYTAQQLNLNHIPLVRDGIASGATTSGEFVLAGTTMVGQLLHDPYIDWHVLVAQPTALAYRPLRLTLGVLGLSLFTALLVGVLAALHMARLLALRFEQLTGHARQVAAGTAAQTWPRSDIREFEDLGENLQRMAAAIREQERQLATLMSNLPGMVHRFSADGRCQILFASRGSLALTGYAAEDLIARQQSFLDLVHPEDRERFWREVSERLRQELPYEVTFRLCARDGGCRWVSALGQGIETGTVSVIEGFVTDITSRVEAELALRDALQHAEDANRAKSAFLANMSHELRTPLNGVLGMLQLLEHGTELTAEQREYIQVAGTSGWSLLNLLNDILDLSRIEAGRMELHEEPADVGALATSVTKIFQPVVEEKRVELRLVLAPELAAPVSLDVTRVRQILFNLVGNAVKFTLGGRVTLTLGPLAPGPNGRGRLQLEVADTGIGMSPELQGRLFSPFTQGEESFQRRFQGAGLGLSIVRRLVDLMHGTIAVASREGEGTTFTVEIEVGLPPDRFEAAATNDSLQNRRPA